MRFFDSDIESLLPHRGDGDSHNDWIRFRGAGQFHEMMHVSGSGDPLGILMVASGLRDDAPWLYELTMEMYRAAKSGDAECIRRELIRLRNVSDLLRSPLMMDLGDRESHMLAMEMPRMLDHILHSALERARLENKKTPQRKRSTKSPQAPE